MESKRVLSCIQPTGEIHIGNYFGAIKNWVEIQDKYECFYGIVDYHAMTMPYDIKQLRENTKKMFIELLACGVCSEKSILFVQSLVPQHTELNWILNCTCSYGELSRMTQFKDKSEYIDKDNIVSSGLFTYPILQAADILIYNADYVPVGKDQEQHLELTRNIANKFNNKFGTYFTEPKPLFTDTPKIMSLSCPNKKMSKSMGEKNYIGLFENEDSIRKKVRSAVTDTNITEKMSDGIENLFCILKATNNEYYSSLINDYNNNTLKYSILKDTVANSLVHLTSVFIKNKKDIIEDNNIDKIMKEMSEKAKEHASKTISEVRTLVGINY